jgi:hypothetical protein
MLREGGMGEGGRERAESKVVDFMFVQSNYFLTRSRPCHGPDDWSPASRR